MGNQVLAKFRNLPMVTGPGGHLGLTSGCLGGSSQQPFTPQATVVPSL